MNDLLELADDPWKQAGREFASELVRRGASMDDVVMLCQGAGAFGAFLSVSGWTLTPPPQ